MAHAYLLIYLICLALIATTVLRFLREKKRYALADAPPQPESAKPAFLNFLAAACVAVGIFGTASLFFEGPMLFALRVLGGVIFAAALLEAGIGAHCWYRHILDKPVVHRKQLIMPGIASLIGFCILEFTVSVCGIPGGAKNAPSVAWPVRGNWKVITGGQSALTNYHHNNPPAQNCAVDVVRSSGTTEGEVVYTPTDGSVVQAINNRTAGSAEPEGNIVIIKTADGVEIWLAHLQQNSVKVQVGDVVKQGQELARCGATGSADEPHLHIHAQKENQPIPLLFGPNKKFLLRNDHFEAKP